MKRRSKNSYFDTKRENIIPIEQSESSRTKTYTKSDIHIKKTLKEKRITGAFAWIFTYAHVSRSFESEIDYK